MGKFKNKIADEFPKDELLVFDAIRSGTKDDSPFLYGYEHPNTELRLRDKTVDFYYNPGLISESNQVDYLYGAYKHLRYLVQK